MRPASQAVAALDTVSEIAPDFVRLLERGEELAATGRSALPAPASPGAVRWVDVGAQLRLVESPLDIAQAVQEKLLRSGRRRNRPRAPGSLPRPRWATMRA